MLDLQPCVERFEYNQARVHELVNLYYLLSRGRKGRKSVHQTEILRAAVVLLHASLEDFLRSIARICLPIGGKKAIDAIPLAGSKRRSERFSLGELLSHRGKTVDEVVEESVAKHLERSNYNNTSEVASLLVNLGIDIAKVNARFPDLGKMMERRHQIVHRADCTEEAGKGKHRTHSLRAALVEKWITATTDFMSSVVKQLQSLEDASKQS